METICQKVPDGRHLVHFFQSSLPPKIFVLDCFQHELVTIYLCWSQLEENDNQSSCGYFVN